MAARIQGRDVRVTVTEACAACAGSGTVAGEVFDGDEPWSPSAGYRAMLTCTACGGGGRRTLTMAARELAALLAAERGA